MAKNVDMTIGSPFKKIFLFALPLAISYLLQTFYSLGDTLIVSLSRGEDAVTGINVTSSMFFLVNGFAQGLSAGFGIVLSQYVGAKNEQRMRKSVATSIMLTIVFSLFLTAVFVVCAPTILKLMKTNEQYFEYAKTYIQAIFSGIIFTSLYNLSSQIMRAMGDGKTPLVILIFCATLNLLLNSLLFITDLPASWAGWATIISQALSAVIGFLVIFKKYNLLRVKKEDFSIEANFIKKHLATGLPMAFQTTITAISCMVQQYAFNGLPDPAFAMAQGTASKIDNLFNSVLFGSAVAMAVYCGQNYGANKLDRIKSGVKYSYLIGLIFTSFSMLLNFTLCRSLSKILLIGADDRVHDLIFDYIAIQSIFYYALCMLLYVRESLQGLGKSSLTVIGGICELFMRCFACFVLAKHFSYLGACFSNALAWIGGMACFIICYKISIFKMQKRAKYGSIFSV
ncbi:MAG: polysaccharide biosynthesis C-terminal domain-containing protein [Clostridia bacterium]|nr:polysaccharide biosynthesis C-terminal domain-containing protein [Clostridia bacterium]